MFKTRKLLLAGLALGLCATGALAQTRLDPFQPGFRQVDGSKLNLMVNSINNLQGTGTPAAVTGTTGSFNSLVARAATFPHTGLAAAQGGSVSLVGGTSSTTGNAGGAVVLTGGVAGATGVGGAITLTSGAGGATSGAAGAISLTAATATSANGASITLTAGAGAGGTNAGGNLNLVPGAAVSTGIPGQLQVNGNSSLMCGSYVPSGTPAATDAVFYVATRPLLLVSVSQIHSVAAGGASVLQVVKDTGTNAPGAGTDLLTNNTNTGFDLNATANTTQVGTLTATIATKTLAAGDRLSVDYANTIQSTAGVVVTACFAPL